MDSKLLPKMCVAIIAGCLFSGCTVIEIPKRVQALEEKMEKTEQSQQELDKLVKGWEERVAKFAKVAAAMSDVQSEMQTVKQMTKDFGEGWGEQRKLMMDLKKEWEKANEEAQAKVKEVNDLTTKIREMAEQQKADLASIAQNQEQINQRLREAAAALAAAVQPKAKAKAAEAK